MSSKRARSPQAAIQRHYGAMRSVIHCVSSDAFWVMPSDKREGVPFDMFFSDVPLALWRTGPGDRVRVHLVARQSLEVYQDRERGEYRCRTLGYIYTVSDADLAEMVSWHWHPDTHPAPHVHVPALDAHIPSGRVTFESVIRFLIEELSCQPTDDKWDDVLTAREERHKDFRSWH